MSEESRSAPDELVMRFLDGDLRGDTEASALHRIADDPEARDLLRFDADLRRLLAPSGSAAGARTVPPGFTEGVMDAVAEWEEGRASSGAGSPGWAARAREALLRPRTLTWRPAHGLAAAAAAAAIAAFALLPAAGPDAPGGAPGEDGAVAAAGERAAPGAVSEEAGPAPASGETAHAETVLVRFVYENGTATSVAVAGDFSRWDPIQLTPHVREGELVWSGVVAVPRGEHRYMFVVDGTRWVTDPRAAAVQDDGFGNRNAILSL